MSVSTSTQPDWRDDWLYALVLYKAEDLWQQWRNPARDPDIAAYVLVEEWSSRQGIRCSGELAHVWVRDADGLREITVIEREQHRQKLFPPRPINPFVLLQFYVEPDRQSILYVLTFGIRAASGGWYKVQGAGQQARLEPDMTRGMWIS